LVADPLHDPRWCRKVKSVEATGERLWIVIHKPVPLRPPMELALEQLDVQSPSRLTREEEDGSIFHVEYRLGPIEIGTRLPQVSEFEWKNFRRVLRGDVCARRPPRHARSASGVEAAPRRRSRVLGLPVVGGAPASPHGATLSSCPIGRSRRSLGLRQEISVRWPNGWLGYGWPNLGR
jgi:hypothetical protein